MTRAHASVALIALVAVTVPASGGPLLDSGLRKAARMTPQGRPLLESALAIAERMTLQRQPSLDDCERLDGRGSRQGQRAVSTSAWGVGGAVSVVAIAPIATLFALASNPTPSEETLAAAGLDGTRPYAVACFVEGYARGARRKRIRTSLFGYGASMLFLYFYSQSDSM